MTKKLSKAQLEALRRIDESYAGWIAQDHQGVTIRRGGERMAGLSQHTLDSLKRYITFHSETSDVYKLTDAGRAAYAAATGKPADDTPPAGDDPTPYDADREAIISDVLGQVEAWRVLAADLARRNQGTADSATLRRQLAEQTTRAESVQLDKDICEADIAYIREELQVILPDGPLTEEGHPDIYEYIATVIVEYRKQTARAEKAEAGAAALNRTLHNLLSALDIQFLPANPDRFPQGTSEYALDIERQEAEKALQHIPAGRDFLRRHEALVKVYGAAQKMVDPLSDAPAEMELYNALYAAEQALAAAQSLPTVPPTEGKLNAS